MKNIFQSYLWALLAIVAAGCTPIDTPEDLCPDGDSPQKVLLLYSAGFNSLREYLLDDINDLKKGWLPAKGCDKEVLLVYSHTLKSYGNYRVKTNPYLIRLSRDGSGNTICDTLVTYETSTISASAEQINNVLTYIRDEFPSESYGMIFSSHATGYLPAGYYTNPDGYRFPEKGMMRSRGFRKPQPVPYIAPDFDPSLPMVKSIGQDLQGYPPEQMSYEIDLPDFAEAIPMQLDYILFDACLMGGIEVAYELRGKCRKVGFPQTEVLAEGFDYTTLTEHLLNRETPDPQKVCEDFFIQYDICSGIDRSATISLVDCEALEPLSEVCRRLFESHREGLKTIDPNKVQRYYRQSRKWFYDLESMVYEAGATAEELAELQAALEGCVIYKAHTPEFMCEFAIETHSGLSTYLPRNGNAELNKYYKTLQWNIDTGLVE